MSLNLDVGKVRSVLLTSAGGWLDIKIGTFAIDTYEFRNTSMGQTGPGFTFRDNSGNIVSGPVTSILAVRTIGEVEKAEPNRTVRSN